jgi:predicted transposase YdaD
VNRCIAEDILKDFLLERGEDVQKSMMFDLTYEKQMENAKREWYNDGVEEGRAEGYSSGIAEGRASGIAEGTVRYLVASVVKKVQKNKTLDQIADELEESVEDIHPIYDIVKKHAPEYDADTITTEVLEARENEKV